MLENKNIMVLVALVLLAWTGGRADNINGVTMDFVTIGGVGNAADVTGYGSVGYVYRIGRYEVSVAQFQASGIVDANANDWSDGTLASLGTGAPVVNITWHQAAQYCNWLTSEDVNIGAYTIVDGLIVAVDRAAAVAAHGTVYVMPTEDEWYKAAYYKNGSYSLFANGTGSAPVNGSNALYSASSPWTVTSGTAEQNGTFNMMGNVWEHFEAPYADEILDFTDENQEMISRGGAYTHSDTYLSAATRDINNTYLRSTEVPQLGMRIVAIPEPGTFSLMSLSTIGLFFTRTLRRRKLMGKSLFPGGHECLCDSYCSLEECGIIRIEAPKLDIW